MALLRMDHVSVVVDDLEAAIAFFVELGMELQGRAPIEGPALDRLNALDGARVEIAMLRVPGTSDGLELTTFSAPAAVAGGPNTPNALGLRSVMFAVDDLDDTVARLRGHGAEPVGTVEKFENGYRLAYLRGPAGVIVALAEQLG